MMDESLQLGGTARQDPDHFGRRRLLLSGLLLCLVASVFTVWQYNQSVAEKPLERVLLNDPRNKLVKATAHFDGWVDFDSLVFDVTDISGDAARGDVFRVFLQYAEAQKARRFQRVILSGFGTKKFIVPGDYFQQLGQEYATQNPIYTIRTFPEHVSGLDGSRPFPPPSGGLLYVLGEELKQANELHDQWYGNDWAMRHKQ